MNQDTKDKHRIHVETGSAAKPEEAQQPAETKAEPAVDLAAVVSEQLTRLQTEKDELMQTLVRRQADFENYRKRIDRERQEEHRRGVGRVIEELLPFLDGFERALDAYKEKHQEEVRKGLELMHRQLWEILSRHGLERIDTSGKMFDPHFHQAVERVETTEYPDGAIVSVLHDGYLFHGRVLRPSLVRVAVNTEEQHAVERGG